MPGFANYKKGCTRLAAASDKVYQLLAHGRWFSPASSTTKTGRHDIVEILLKVALNTINQSNQPKSNRNMVEIRVITKLPNSEQSYKGKVKTHKYINRQNQSTTGKL